MSTLLATSSQWSRRHSLGKALPVFKEDWIRDHLLGKAPRTDAALISSPLQQMHSVSFESDLNFDRVNYEQGGNNVGTMMSSESVMVPAYSRDGLNLGFCLSETAGLATNSFIQCHNGPSIQSFTFREDNGHYIAFERLDNIELLIFLSTNQNRRERNFFTFAFPGRSFSTLIEKGVDDPVAFERILCANVQVKYVAPCPRCCASIGAICDCSSRFRASQMPLDLSAIAENISLNWLGSGAGTGLFEVFTDGVPAVSIQINSSSNSCHTVKQGRTERFVARAVADVLKNTPVQVVQELEPPPSNDVVHVIEQTNSDAVLDNCQEQVPNSTAIDAISSVFEQYEISLDHSYPTVPPPDQVSTTAQYTTEQASLTITENVTTTTTFPVTTAQSSASANGSNFVTLPLLSNSQLESSLPSTNTCEPVIRTSIAHRKITRALPIAPRIVVQTTPLHPADASIPDEAKMKKMAEQLREWRAYHRKIRNRESARRSNLMRKQRNESARRNQRKATGGTAD